MPARKRPSNPISSVDAKDHLMSLQQIYRTEAFGARRDIQARDSHRALVAAESAEPNAELEDSELNDAERQSAIARERMRRDGR